MHYKITEVKNSSIVVEFEDESWAEVPIRSGMTADEIDQIVEQFAPKDLVLDESIKSLVGQTRTVKAPEQPTQEEQPVQEWEDTWETFDREQHEEDLVNKITERVLARLNS